MLGNLSADIICSEKRTVLRERSSGKTVRYEEQIMCKDKYPSIFSRQMVTIVYIFPNFENCARCEKDLKDNKDNSLHLGRKYINNSRHLARKYARIFVRGHYLFWEANSFPRAKLEENRELRLSLLSFKSFLQRGQFWKLWNIPGYSPVLAGE